MDEKFPALVVDKEGLARKLSRKPKAFIAFELIQNARDEDVEEVLFNASTEGENQCVITIEDDCPEGFKEMESVYTLFRDSKKAPDPTKRGRFELGEKLVIAAAVNVKLVTTKGTVMIRGAERYHTDEKTNRGATFSARFKMTRQEMDDVLAAAQTMLPSPSGVKTTLNGEVLPHREPAAFEVQLPTEVSDEDGHLRRTVRWLDPAGGTVLAHVRLYDDGKASVCVAWLDEEWGDKPPKVGDRGLEIGLETVVRIEEDGDPCPGRGKCHGCVKWCDECGDVDWTCDDPKCDAHPRISELKEDTGFMKERVDEAERELRDRLKDFQEAEGLLREAQEAARSGQRMVPR